MLQNKRKGLEFVGSMLLSAMVFLIIYKFIPIVYSTNDDRMIAEIISGQFTGRPESYAIQMTYGFTWFLSKLYEMTREFNWYGIVLIGVQVFSFGAVLYRLQSFSEKWMNKLYLLLAAVLLYVGLWLKVYVQLTYTTTAAFVGMAAIFWYATSKTDWKNILLVGILVNIAFSIRPNVFYLLLPATGLVYLWKLMGKKQMDKRTIFSPFIILAVTACLFLVNASAYSKEGWKEFMEFFDDRTNVFDYYDLRSFEENKQLYEPYGISEEEYNMMRVYNYTVMDDLPIEFFPEYLEACSQLEKEQGNSFVNKAADAVKIFVKDVFTNSYGVENTILFVLAVVLFILLIISKEYLQAAYLGIQSVAICAVWLYFTYWGRAIERIQMTMSLIFLAVILHVAVEMSKKKNWMMEDAKEKEKWGMAIKVFFFVGLILIAVLNFRTFRYDNIAKAHRYSDVEKIKEFCAENPDNLYYMDVATMTELYGTCNIKNTEPAYINYIALGDWSAYCPHYEEKLKNHGVEDIEKSLTDENTYVIMLHNYQLKCLKDYTHLEESWEKTIWGAGETAYAVYQFH